MNDLTKRLLAEGYDKDHPPEYARWSDWKDFEYTHAALLEMLWEAPCGLIQKGCGYEHGSHLGVDYCPENDNPRFGCPHYDEVPCPHRFNTNLMGWNCAFHQIVRDYDYEISVEKIRDEWERIQSKAWQEAISGYGYCNCLKWDRKSRKYLPRFDVSKCIAIGCKNEVCAITKKQRNLQKVNIYYDILRVWRYQKGLLESTEKKLEKGIRVFKTAITRSDAEIWLKQHGEEKFAPKQTSADRRDQFFSERHGKEGFGEYTLFEFTLTAQNIRIDVREHRDLKQDLADITEGFEVVHASDLKKQKEQEKRDRKIKRQEAKRRRKERESRGSAEGCLKESPMQLPLLDLTA